MRITIKPEARQKLSELLYPSKNAHVKRELSRITGPYVFIDAEHNEVHIINPQTPEKDFK